MALTLRPPHQPVKKKAVIDGMIIRFVPDCADVLFYLAVVDAEELIRTSSHVHIVRFSLRNASGSETGRQVHSPHSGAGGHDLEQGLTEPGSTFGSFVAL